MDRYDTFYGRESKNHQNQVVDVILNYGFLASAKLAVDERHRQFRHEAALDQLLLSAEGTDARASLSESVRHRLGTLLIRLGTALQGASAAAPQLPGTNRAAASP